MSWKSDVLKWKKGAIVSGHAKGHPLKKVTEFLCINACGHRNLQTIAKLPKYK